MRTGVRGVTMSAALVLLAGTAQGAKPYTLGFRCAR